MTQRFRVTCEHRTDSGMTCSTSTDQTTVTVSAESAQDARLLAIDATHEAHAGGCSHVRPVHVHALPAFVAIVETVHASPEIPLWRWVITFYQSPAGAPQRIDTHSALSFGGALAQVAQGRESIDPAAVYHVTDTRRAGEAHRYTDSAFRLRTLCTETTPSRQVGHYDSLQDAIDAALEDLESADAHAALIGC